MICQVLKELGIKKSLAESEHESYGGLICFLNEARSTTDAALIKESDCNFSLHLISEKCNISTILDERPEDGIFQQKVKDLSKRYSSIRKTLGDGNCFYRALGFAYLESLLGNPREIRRFKEILIQSKNELVSAGFEENVFGNYFNALASYQIHFQFFSVIELIERDHSSISLLQAFNDQSCSDSIVQYLRFLSSAFLRNRADFFQHFVEDGMTIKDFCTQDVEPMAMECDHIQITALSQALEIPLQVEYVDENATAINQHRFPETAIPSVYMLYTRAHYSILY
ncbi:ubiquitin thioesterase OTUB2 [Rhinatrema bivittatum]|uniref:ubiquitin thioesterase OTUB2 n=1 Tax=Rhinatrema bivittatum TaxID=194408 RepID=UPI001128EE4C|nr:ubiquitin thioesterase OTUB2 [Rhinatrema bivittatum]